MAGVRGGRAGGGIDVRVVVLSLLGVLVFVTRVLAQVDDRAGDDYQHHTLLLPVDLVLAAAAVLGLVDLVRGRAHWRRFPLLGAGLILGLAMVPALVAHPSDRGVAAVARWVAASLAGVALVRLRGRERRVVLWVVAVTTALSSLVALGQRALGRRLGLDVLGEAGVLDIGAPAVSGLLVHPYVMAAWVAVVVTALAALGMAGRWQPPPVLLLVAAAPLGLSMARAGAIAGVAAAGLLVAAAVRSDRRPVDRLLAGAVVVGFAAGVVVNFGGWVDRAGGSVPTRSDDVASGRSELFDQARELLETDPAFGVGPGNYVLALRDRPALVLLSPQSPRPVHNVPALLVVEGGLVALPAVALWVVAAAVRAVQGGLRGGAVVVAYLPFLLLDHLAWSYPQGIVLTALWMASLDLLASQED